jgi:hypothetical protein
MMKTLIPLPLSLLIIYLTSIQWALVSSIANADEDVPFDGSEIGSFDRFWKYHSVQKSLIDPKTGTDQYHNIQNCLQEKIGHIDFSKPNDQRRVGLMLREPEEDYVYALIVKNAFLDSHVLAVQQLAHCVRTFMPHLYESRAMYQEMNLDQDDGLGGNCPTHLGSLVPLFLPQVRREMKNVLLDAYEAAGWKDLTEEEMDQEDYDYADVLPFPENVGIRASEHLTYSNFPQFAEHTDGITAFTMNFALSGPEDYQGGAFFIIELTGKRKTRYIKPDKKDAIVFLGGRYLHGVSEITGGHREMFSTEFWPYADLPFGTTLWSAVTENMEQYIRDCNEVQMPPYDEPCTVEFIEKNAYGLSMDEVRQKYAGNQDASVSEHGEAITEESDETSTKLDANETNQIKMNRVKPGPFMPVRVRDPNTGKEYDLARDFLSDEHDFFVPNSLEPGEMVALRWKNTSVPVDGSEGESYIVGFPPELLHEFQALIAKNNMMNVARSILYDEKPLEYGEHRLYELKDGQKWGAMVQGSWDTDMVWYVQNIKGLW